MFDGNLAESSNYGAKSVDIAAPGTYIVSTIANSGYGFMTGTSMSTPMVTGAAAFLYSYRTDLHLSDIRKVLLETARKIPPLEGKLSSNGMLDVYAALNYGRAAENTAESAGTDNGGSTDTGNGGNADSTGADVSAAVGNTGNPESAQSGQETQSSGDTAQRESQTTTSKTITAGGGEPIRLGQ